MTTRKLPFGSLWRGKHQGSSGDETEPLPHAARPRTSRRILSDANDCWLRGFAAYECGSHSIHRSPFPIPSSPWRTAVSFSLGGALRTFCLGVMGLALRAIT